MPDPVEAASVEAAAPVTGDPIVTKLTARFAAMENPAQVGNSSEPKAEAPADPVKEELKADEPAKIDEPKEEPKEDDKEPKADETEKPNGDEDDESEELSTAYPESEDALKAQWPRAVPLKVIDQAYKWSVEAKEGKEVVDALGGKPFVEPLTKMASALQQENAPLEAFAPFFEGVNDAGGETALKRVMAQSIHMAFVQGPEWQKMPETKAFGDDLQVYVDAAMQERFGVGTETMASLAELQSIGAIDGLTQLLEGEYLDEDKDFDTQAFYDASKKFYDDIRAIQHNPKLKAQTLENIELKRQLEERNADAKKAPEPDYENSFGEYIGNVIDKISTDVLFTKTSPLSDIASDTPEMKEKKAYFRKNITATVRQSLMNGDKKILLDGFRSGKHSTAIYQTTLAKAMGKAISKADSDRKMAEDTIAALYGKTRNAKLLEKQNPATSEVQEAPLTPTTPTNFAPKEGPKTDKQILDNLTRSFAAHDANKR